MRLTKTINLKQKSAMSLIHSRNLLLTTLKIRLNQSQLSYLFERKFSVKNVNS